MNAAKLVLESICTNWVMSREQVPSIACHTFYQYLRDRDSKFSIDIEKALLDGLEFLLEHKFVIWKEKRKITHTMGKSIQIVSHQIDTLNNEYEDEEFSDDEEASEATQQDHVDEIESEFEATALGLATFQSSFSIDDATFVNAQIHKALSDGIIFEEDLHIVYLLTPITNLIEPNWNAYFNLYNRLSPTRIRIAKLVGLDESILVSRTMDKYAPLDPTKVLIATRFFNALLLTDIVNEMNYFDVGNKYSIESRGAIQNIMTSAGQFSSMMVAFCSRLKLLSLEVLFRKYASRIGHGVKDDVVELMSIEGMTRTLARTLYEFEFETVRSIATVTPKKLFDKVGEMIGIRPKATAKLIVANARRVLNKESYKHRNLAEELDALL